MTDDQLLRYARHLMLDEIGIEGQRRLLASSALVIGAGGLGSPVALYLASAGVGRLTVVDDDAVDLTNLQRQIAHATSRIGWPKAVSVQASVAAINPDVQVAALVQRADAALLAVQVAAVDVVVDCSDNFATRHAVNAACVAAGRPLVWGAAVGWDGQMSSHVFDADHATPPGADPQAAGGDAAAEPVPGARAAAPVPSGRGGATPCYACLFPPDGGYQDVACATMGVFAPLVGIVGSVQAAEALAVLLGRRPAHAGRLAMLDARTMTWDGIAVARNPGCRVCGRPPVPEQGTE